jgi:antitoxin YefM
MPLLGNGPVPCLVQRAAVMATKQPRPVSGPAPDAKRPRVHAALTNIMVQPIIVVMKTMSLAAAKTRFSALVEEAVATHEQVTVTRNGEPAVVVLSVEDFESLLETLAILQDPADRTVFEQARREADEGDVTDEEEMAALMRERLARRAVR